MTHRLPLFERFPQSASLPRVELCDLPTPVNNIGDILPLDSDDEPVYPIHALFVKRDDLTSPAYGGNKVRKLEFLLGDAIARGARSVITFGAYGSNHALATAVHARAVGLEPHAVLSPQEPGPYAPRTLLAHARLGTGLHLVDGWDGRREAVRVKRELEERDGVEPYVIPMGGTCAVGALGYVNAALEMVAQPKTLDIGFVKVALSDFVEPNVVYLAAGTLGTAVGLAIGFAAAQRATRVEAIRVTPLEICNEDLAEKLAEDTVALLRAADPTFPELRLRDLHFSLRHEFFEPGYGIPTPETLEAVRFAAQADIKLETTYTGKAFSAMLADSQSGRLDPNGDHALFWDTYNSAPYPAPGPEEALPAVLREYIAECRRLFPDAAR